MGSREARFSDWTGVDMLITDFRSRIIRWLIAAAFLLMVIFAWFTWNIAVLVIQTLADGPPARWRPSGLAGVFSQLGKADLAERESRPMRPPSL